MVLTAQYFSALLQSLGLTQGFYKPTPGATVPSVSSLSDYNLPPDGSFSGSALANDMEPPSYIPSKAYYSQQNSSKCSVDSYEAPPIGNQTFPPFDQAKATVYRYRQQQTVNLGSWFVHEAWMTPSVFTCAAGPQLSEIDIASGWNSTAAAATILEHHWDTFINQSDFEYLASIGINTVRLPIGYWNLGPEYCQGTPYEAVASVYNNSWSRVARAINMAGEAGLGVLVDLHGAPGSQNGQPHSGISDGITGLFNNQTNMDLTINVLSFLATQLVDVSNVVGIEILNEPQADPGLPDFYTRAIAELRNLSAAAADFPFYIHDAFSLDVYTEFIHNRTDFVVLDHHSYFVFTESDDEESATQHTVDVKSSVANLLISASMQTRRNLIIDEWSCALTPDSLANVTDPSEARQDFCAGQMAVYTNVTAGWGFWSYNKENCTDDPGWCFKAAVGNSLPSSFFSYGQGPLTDPDQLSSLAGLIGDMNAPAASSILANASDASSATAIGDTTADTQPTQAPAPVNRRSRSRARRTSASSMWKRLGSSLDSIKSHKRNYDTGMSPSQRSIAKGYSDGFFTAKIFAQYGMSKLGFTGQYIRDSIAKLGPEVIQPGTEGNYSEWFMKGLQDGENIVMSHVNGTAA